jgi:hypothetical protein
MSRFRKVSGAVLLATAAALALTSPGSAGINHAGALLVPQTLTPKYCSGAFRYAARTGNSDISPLSPAQVFANDRRFARTRTSALAMNGFGEQSRLLALNTMCGSR